MSVIRYETRLNFRVFTWINEMSNDPNYKEGLYKNKPFALIDALLLSAIHKEYTEWQARRNPR